MSDMPIVILGSGVAGMSAALALAPRPVLLVTKTDTLAGGSSPWAQGGIAAALGAGDTPARHADDTVRAGAGLTDAAVARLLAEDGVDAVAGLVARGVPFDRVDGALSLGREAAHGLPRIVHAGGDRTGAAVVETLAQAVREAAHIEVLTATFAVDLAVADRAVHGVLLHSAAAGWWVQPARGVILATGGWGMVWRETTNPAENTGDGLAMAARAGALLADLEFMQFHPTALHVESDGSRLPLLTEALRGAGAKLLDGQGRAFMAAEHRDAELAPRDVVARAVGTRAAAGEDVYLDLRPALDRKGAGAFPQVLEACRLAGHDPWTAPVPVVPAAHYAMGGVVTDHRGRTSLAGLWACGEVGCTGVHGANRLASNSLLEALVFGRRVAEDLSGAGRIGPQPGGSAVPLPSLVGRAEAARVVADTRRLMSRHVGLVRDGQGLWQAGEALRDLAHCLAAADGVPAAAADIRAGGEARNLLTVARLAAAAAERRRESRGAHFRTDFPQADPAWRHRLTQRLGEPVAAAAVAPVPPAAE